MSSYRGEFVRLEEHGDVRQLVLAAPQRRNALDMPMLREIAEAIDRVAADADARALVVSGEGPAFCAGADVHSLFGDPTRPTGEIRGDLKEVYASFLGLQDLTIPTISAVDGPAVGAGVNIALACDVVIAGPGARFAITFADIGLHPGGGCTWFLTRRLGAPRAMAVLLGAETLDAEAAFAGGLVSARSDEPVAHALSLAETYARRDPALVRDIKRAVQVASESDLATVLELESWAQASSVGQPRFQEFMTQFGRR